MTKKLNTRLFLALLFAAAFALPESTLASNTIPGLPDGGTVQNTDMIPVSRGTCTNCNYRVVVGSAATQSTGTFLQTANNLGDLTSALTARTNLGLGTAAQQDIAAFLQPSNNLSDIGSASAARSNLGLGTASILNATGILQPVNNLSDVSNATTALNNLLPAQAGHSGQCLSTNATNSSWGACGSGSSVSVTSASTNIVITPSPGTGTFTIGATDLINAQGTAASYTILASDMAKTITHTRSSSMADALPQAGTTGFETGKSFSEINIGTGVLTITPTTSTINGLSTLTLNPNQSAYIISDGTNYVAGFLGGNSITTPVSVANGGTGIASGTSGGILAFTGSGTLASSGALTANLPVIGGGAGVAPTVGTVSGNTTKFATVTGALSNGHCASIDASGNLIDSGSACGGSGGSGTVNSATSGQMTFYAGTGTAVSGNANATVSSGALTLGQAASVQGSVILSGSTSGTTTLAAPVSGGGTQTFQAGSDTVVGRATTDTLTNKTISGSSNTLSNIATSSLATIQGNGTKVQLSTGTTTTNDCVKFDANGNTVDAGSACGAGSGAAFQVQPSSTYTADTAGNLFPYVYTGAGGNASAHEAGWGVAASLAASPVLEMRFPMPSVLPSGTFKLVSTCLANASSGVMKYTVSDANVASGSNPSSASLSAETQTSITWSAADTYIQTKTVLTSTPTANGTSVVAVTYNASGYTLAAIGMCRYTEIWE